MTALADCYREYNRCCNEHRFDDLGGDVADDVIADGELHGVGRL